MKKTYTKEQITEAISYWKKQLVKGNYRKINEDLQLVETDGNFTIGAVLKGNIIADIYPNHFYKLKTVDQILHDSYAYECWFKYAESMFPSVMRLEVFDLSKPISGGRWFNDAKDKDLFDPDENERKKAWDNVVKWMKSARGQRALDDDKVHGDEALGENIAHSEKKQLLESSNFASPSDVNNMPNDKDVKEEAAKLVAGRGWYEAFALAYGVLRKGADTYIDIDKEIGGKCYSLAEDVKSMMFAAAKEGKLPKEGYRG